MYIILAVAGDEENQRNGIVAVGYYVGSKDSDFNFDNIKIASPYLKCAPIRLCAKHFCTDDPMKQILVAFLTLLPWDTQVRRQVHFGEYRSLQPQKKKKHIRRDKQISVSSTDV